MQIRGNAPKYAQLANGSRLFFLSADNPDAIRGYGFIAIALDEAALLPAKTWFEVIWPTIAQTEGRADLAFTPQGRNWTFKLHTRGLDPEELEYDSFTFPSIESPYFSQKMWIEAKRTFPTMAFEQEFEAKFLEDSAGVFRGVAACAIPKCTCTCEASPVIGCDLAKHQDFTVLISACPVCGQCREFQRFNRIDWSIQRKHIYEFVTKRNGELILDSTGVGDPVYDELRNMGLSVTGYKFTSQSKQYLVQQLMLRIENGTMSWPEDWDILIAELMCFEYEIGSTGHIRYNAPEGFHDDCVIALGLVAVGLSKYINPTFTTEKEYQDYEKAERERAASEMDEESEEDMESRIIDTDGAWSG